MNTCPICAKPIPSDLLMCGPHWTLVPDNLQAGVWAAWREYQRCKDTRVGLLAAARGLQQAHAAAKSAVKERLREGA